jgi:hypothetical protein
MIDQFVYATIRQAEIFMSYFAAFETFNIGAGFLREAGLGFPGRSPGAR